MAAWPRIPDNSLLHLAHVAAGNNPSWARHRVLMGIAMACPTRLLGLILALSPLPPFEHACSLRMFRVWSPLGLP